MNFETWWLSAIPILFALGWIAARVDSRELLSESRKLPRSYFEGLNFLLNEDHDKAIDAFVEVAKLDTETIELHFALGSLFRRRGEIERAIRVHQSLLNRADLPEADQVKALYEIGHDYFKAGMFDTAESAFLKVMGSEQYEKDAIYALIRIYEAQHDWQKAMQVVRQLQDRHGQEVPQIVHYYCELAAQAMSQQTEESIPRVLEYIHSADEELKNNPHASAAGKARLLLLKARLARQQADDTLERQLLEQIFLETPPYGDLAAAALAQNFERTQREEHGFEFLHDKYLKQPSLNVLEQILKHMRKTKGAHETYQLAATLLANHPSLLGLQKLIEVELASQDAPQDEHGAASSGEDREKLVLTKASIQKQGAKLDRYVCRECGFQARNYYWQCPGCHHWETYSTRRLEEL